MKVKDVEDAKKSAKLTELQIRIIDELHHDPSYCEALADKLGFPSKRLNANLHALERRGHLTSWIVAVPLSTAGIRSVRMWRALTERERLEGQVDERRNLWLSNRALELMRPRFEPMLELHRMMRERTPNLEATREPETRSQPPLAHDPSAPWKNHSLNHGIDTLSPTERQEETELEFNPELSAWMTARIADSKVRTL
jgi:hypothetical protein